jgi:hypothetical protein
MNFIHRKVKERIIYLVLVGATAFLVIVLLDHKLCLIKKLIKCSCAGVMVSVSAWQNQFHSFVGIIEASCKFENSSLIAPSLRFKAPIA